jgi:pilus assembly protein Flp/PilA
MMFDRADLSSHASRKDWTVLALWTQLAARVKDEKGASMVEYALLVVLIAIIALIAISIAGQNVSKAFSTIASSLAAAN